MQKARSRSCKKDRIVGPWSFKMTSRDLREEGYRWLLRKKCLPIHVKFSAKKWKNLKNHVQVVNNATPLCPIMK